ncbi:MAG TPA: protocatechuate 3,4-dioxygenase subunit beta [Candidatus Limnocylindrales bacterium]
MMTNEPPLYWPDYKSTMLRAPQLPPKQVDPELAELTGPVFGESAVGPLDHDLTRGLGGEPIGERIIVHGKVTDADGRPIPHSLIEVWQTNSAGRYSHDRDQHPAPLDPHFNGVGRCLTDAEGNYRFVTIRPGAYPWRNHHNAWRPAHIHFSLFGRSFLQRMITQMYFPGDPLLAHDPILDSVPEPARDLLVAQFDLGQTVPEWALAFRWDIVLRSTPMEDPQ